MAFGNATYRRYSYLKSRGNTNGKRLGVKFERLQHVLQMDRWLQMAHIRLAQPN